MHRVLQFHVLTTLSPWCVNAWARVLVGCAQGSVIVYDLNPAMLNEGRKKAERLNIGAYPLPGADNVCCLFHHTGVVTTKLQTSHQSGLQSGT